MTVEALYLIAGAVVGVLVRSWLTNGQKPLSRETFQDVFLGVVLAVAWLMPIGSFWPPFDFPPSTPAWMHGVLFAGGTWLFIEMAKAALLKWAPEIFSKYTGQLAPPPVLPTSVVETKTASVSPTLGTVVTEKKVTTTDPPPVVS